MECFGLGLGPISSKNAANELHPTATLMTDELKVYTKVGREYARHGVIKHNDGLYVQGDVTTNTVEGFFSLLKRGINGIFHHVPRSICPSTWPSLSTATTSGKSTMARERPEPSK